MTTKRHGESTLSGSDNRNATTTFPAFFEFILFWNQRQTMNLEVGQSRVMRSMETEGMDEYVI
jgi:hypothetical protein